MEFMAEFTEGMSRDRARQIIKGKRTKRNRPSSPVCNTDDGDCLIDNFDEPNSVSTKEDEDMANCLIMLARSVSPVANKKISDQICPKTEKVNCRRSTEISNGLYAYECKTCNRTFPSFQALGGHRASHKKPKLHVDEKISSSVNYNNNNINNIIIQPQPLLMEDVEEDNDRNQQEANYQDEDEENKASIIINTTTTITNNNNNNNNNNNVQSGINIISNSNTKAKVHECSICGSEFLSGQALGGHMRKHRPIPPTGNRSTGISTTTDDSTADQITEKSASNMLSLDLNFPPPEVVEEHFQFTGGPSQQRMVFSAPAFVDCHY